MIGVYIFTILAFLISILLVVIDNSLNKTSKKEETILKLLPNYNCGACGYQGCQGMVKAILEDPNNLMKCRPLKEKEIVLEKIKEEI